MGDRPAVVTVPNVEILEVGTWTTSTGTFTWTAGDLAAAVAAFDDPGYTRPVLKLGHVDPRFDGEPALGRLINPRLSEDSMTLVVDIAGVPTWLADIWGTAFPCRSIEGSFGHRTQTGTSHKFALTALSLLGVQAPAVSTLADIAALYGLDPEEVAAKAATDLQEEQPMPAPSTPVRQVRAAVNLDTVRQTFYSDPLAQRLGAWAWVREVYNEFIVVDDDEGHLYRVPWAEGSTPGTVDFGEPTKVRVEYVDLPGDEDEVAASAGLLRRGALRDRLARMAAAPSHDSPANPAEVPPITEGAGPMDPALLRQALGLAPEATDDDVSQALAANGIMSSITSSTPSDPPSDPPTEPEQEATPEPEPETGTEEPNPAPVTPSPPEGVVMIDEAALAELREQAQEGVAARAQQRREARDAAITAAIGQGKIPPARRQQWETYWVKDPDGAKETLASLSPGLVPLADNGTPGGEATAQDAEFDRLFSRPANTGTER